MASTTVNPSSPYLPGLPDLRRIRSFFSRLPLATRGVFLAITGFYIAHLFVPGLNQWGALIPQQINLHTLYRLNTYPLLHRDILHYLLNTLALIPLLDRFESEHGTIVTVILFTGPFGLLPGGLQTFIELFLLDTNTSSIGASIWVFLLLSYEALKTYRVNPHFTLVDVKIPTWTTPLALIFVVNFLIPHTSLLGHLCGAAIGYLWGLGFIRFLAPPDAILKWIETKLNLLGRLPHYVSVDQKTYGRYGVLPSTRSASTGPSRTLSGTGNATAGSAGAAGGQRLGP